MLTAAKPRPRLFRGEKRGLQRRRRCAGVTSRWSGKTRRPEDDNLERIEDDDDLADRIARQMLVPFPLSAALTVNGNLPENYRYCRPWTARFLADLARVHAAAFHRPLEVSSAVRTVAYQKRLMETNGNAAAAEGDIASPHLTGATIDIAKQGMSRQEMGWMRSRLLRLQQAGKIDVEEEFQQACFHITVYKSYRAGQAGADRETEAAKVPRSRSRLLSGLGKGISHRRRGPAQQKLIAQHEPFKGTIAGQSRNRLDEAIMSDPEVQTWPSPTPGGSGLSQWQRVTNTFTAPSKTFEDIKRGNRSWWMPFVILAVVGYIFFAAVAFEIGMQQVVDNQIHLNPKAEEKMAQAPPEAREMSNKISLYITEGIFIANPVLVLAGIALLSLGLWGTINFVFGGKATYGSIFAVWMFAGLPGIIKPTAGDDRDLCGREPETFNIKNFAPTNIGAFLNPLETNKALYTLATSLDAVTIWTLVLLGMGTAIVAGVKRNSGYIAVFGWWAIFVLFSTVVAAAMG